MCGGNHLPIPFDLETLIESVLVKTVKNRCFNSIKSDARILELYTNCRMYRRESFKKAEPVNGDTKTSAGVQHSICKVEHIEDAIFLCKPA
jgi:hypothetical protein